MVDFGLKLEDNKVSEWSGHYMNYDKLKAILKKAKAAQKSYEEQAKKRPEDEAAILKAHRSGDMSFVTTTPAPSALSLQQEEDANERTSLIGSVSTPRGSEADLSSSVKRKGDLPAPLRLTAISDYLGSRYERTVRGYLEQTDKLSSEFEELVYAEQKKTVTFYQDKMAELEGRLQFLVESVVHSAVLAPTFVAFDEDTPSQKSGAYVNPCVRKTRKMGMSPKMRFASVFSIVSRKIKKEKDILHALRKGDTDMALKIELLSDDDDDELDIDNNKIMAEANSIKRALIDQYRTATLLKNFAIMNYTGFVKIIKKHDKTIPEQKGRFKSILESQNLFDEGKEVDALAKLFELYYANWFCEGDVREATAAMLPKKGDGLGMDWSQLRYARRSVHSVLPHFCSCHFLLPLSSSYTG
jgi:SPX domain protein involved in polyphosphate accumulation